MILHNESDVIYGSAPLKTSSFKIRASVKAFAVLSDKLYTHKIRAIIRETSTNAVDAHRLVGSDKPFKVQLPTVLDPRYIIRDYGPGLSAEEVEEIFTVYFASTKDNSNDFTGALGLGAKSPFSYGSRTFTVVSYHKGMKSTYSMVLSSGEPVAYLVSQVESDEPSGLEITVHSQPDDIPTWEREAHDVYRTFSTIRPEFTSDIEIEYLPTTDFDMNDRKCHVVMGDIMYPVPSELYKGTLFHAMRLGPVFQFPIGSLDIQPSREGLSLDERTEEALKNRFAEHDRKLKAEIQQKIDECKTRRELFRVVDRNIDAVIDFICQNMTWKDNPIGPVLQQLRWEKYRDKLSHVYVYYKNHGRKYTYPRPSYRSQSQVSIESVFGPYVEHRNVLIVDKAPRYTLIIKELLNQYPTLVVVDEKKDSKAIEAILDLFAEDERTLLRTSELQHLLVNAPKEKRERRPNKTNVVCLHGQYGYDDLKLTASEIRDLKGVGVLSYNGRYKHNPKHKYQCNMLSPCRDLMKRMGIEKVYEFRPSAYDYIPKDMVMWDDIVEDFLLEELNKIDTTNVVCTASASIARYINAMHTAGLTDVKLEVLNLNNYRRYADGYDCDRLNARIREINDVMDANYEAARLEWNRLSEIYPVATFAICNGINMTDTVIEQLKAMKV